jgi:uncharacterized membrane-anchored protein
MDEKIGPGTKVALAIRASVVRARRILGAVGIVSLVLVGVAAGMMCWALAHHVHCPSCDRMRLGAAFPWWQGYFAVKDWFLTVGSVGALVATCFARRRRYAGLALIGALLVHLFLSFK